MTDGLDLLVRQEELPVGTPGGKKADLRRGALVDGMRPEKNGESTLSTVTCCGSAVDDPAIRFFSRDTYTAMSDSRSSTPSLAPIATAGQGTSDRCRSASPFEVKFSPMVTKRMSLDAFGTHRAAPTSESPAKGREVEVLMEEDGNDVYEDDSSLSHYDDTDRDAEEEEEEDADEEDAEDEGEDLGRIIGQRESLYEGFQSASSSTIREASNTHLDHSFSSSAKLTGSPGSIENTVICNDALHTPRLNKNGLPLPTTESPFIPPAYRQHLSAPPIPTVDIDHDSESKRARAVQGELAAARLAIERLESECGDLRALVEQQQQDKRSFASFEHKVKELEELLREKYEGE